MITNEMIFYGGLVFTVLVVLIAIFAYFIYKIKYEKLHNQLNIEYGEEDKK